MGTTCRTIFIDAGSSKTAQILAAIKSEFKHECIDASITSNAAYLALRAPCGLVYAQIIKYNTKLGGTYRQQLTLCTKPLYEAAHPYFYDIPQRILNKLSPVDELVSAGVFSVGEGEMAQDWRNAVVNHRMLKAIEKKFTLPIGATITMVKPLTFGNGVSASTFRYIGKTARNKRTYDVYEVIIDGEVAFVCRIPNLFNLIQDKAATWTE